MTPWEQLVENEARALVKWVRRGRETLEGVRTLIGIEPDLLDRMKLNCVDALEREAVEESWAFRSAVLLRFNVLAEETQ